jgi:hypothetical protein
MREELKKSEEARKAKEVECVQQLQAMEKAHNDKLDDIANTIHGFAHDFFGKPL